MPKSPGHCRHGESQDLTMILEVMCGSTKYNVYSQSLCRFLI